MQTEYPNYMASEQLHAFRTEWDHQVSTKTKSESMLPLVINESLKKKQTYQEVTFQKNLYMVKIV